MNVSRGFQIRPLIITTAIALAFHLGMTSLAFAQDEAAKSGPGFFTIWVLGGGGILGVCTMLPILMLSVATVAEIIRHSVQMQRDKMVPPETIVELETLLDEEQYEEAVNFCEANRNYVTSVVGAAVPHVSEGFDSMQDAAAGATEEQNMKLQHTISWLNLYGNVGPMLGLFGTVVGMVVAFSVIAASETTPKPNVLANGIFTALVTTVWGLLVSIPALTGYFIFRIKIQRLSTELSGIAFEIVDRFKPVAEKR